MADRIEVLSATVPAGNGSSARSFIGLPFQNGIVSRLEIRVPPGPSGLVGFQIWHSQQRIIPYGSDTFIVANDETLTFDLTGFPQGRFWTLCAYNTDAYDHSVELRFHVDEPVAAAPATPALVSVIEEAPAQSAGVPVAGEPEDPFADEPADVLADAAP